MKNSKRPAAPVSSPRRAASRVRDDFDEWTTKKPRGTVSRAPASAPAQPSRAPRGADESRARSETREPRRAAEDASRPEEFQRQRRTLKLRAHEHAVEPARRMPLRENAVQKQARERFEQKLFNRRAELVEGDVRLQKALARSGIGSRRQMDEAVAAGRVMVNGKPADPGTRVNPGDRVTLDGKLMHLRWESRLPRIIIYHKPEGELVTRDDPEGRVTVFERLPVLKSTRWMAVGRLDYNTSGLLIFTTSGDLANHMTHPRFEIEREYAVRLLGELTDEHKKQLIEGIELEDGRAAFQHIVDQGGEGVNHWYRVVIKEGRNREVRRMFEALGLTVSRLMRVRFGSLSLPPRLKRGQWVELPTPEVQAVLDWLKQPQAPRAPVKKRPTPRPR